MRSSDWLAGFYGVWLGPIANGEAAEASRLMEAFHAKFGPFAFGPECVVGDRMLALTRWYVGDYAGALAPLRRAFSAYDDFRDRTLAFRFGHDAGATILMYQALTLWPMGDIETALRWRAQALERSHKSDHIPTKAQTHCCISVLDAARNDPRGALDHAGVVLNRA